MNRFFKIFIVFFLALLLRIWRLPETATFSYDEARDAAAEKQIIDGKLTLLGPESLIGNKTIYFGPLHYYLMAPVLKLSHFDPIGPYFFTAFLGGITAAILASYFGIGAGLLYAVFPLAVIYNRWAWNPNTIPFFITIALFLYKKSKFYLAGLFWGLAFQLHFTVALFGLIILFNKNFWKILTGFILGVSPIILFDVRHDFLYIKSFIETLTSFSGRGLTWHYFLWLIPVIAVKYPKKIIIIISFLITVVWLSQQRPFYPLNPFYVRQMAKIIAFDQTLRPELNFNVVSFYGGDFKAHNLRYFLDFENIQPLGTGEYDVADHLYVISGEKADELIYNGLYEVSSFKPTRVSKFWRMGETNIYRFEKL